MDQDLIKRRHRELSKRQAMYVAARERGIPRQQSAIMAGYANVDKAGEQVEEVPAVKDELAKARAALVKATGQTREDVAQTILDAIEMARTVADPMAMIRGASELAKLLGLNVPEKKLHLHALNPEDKAALARLSDEELHKIAKGRLLEEKDGAKIDRLPDA